jgi:hypothetical protein
MNEQRIDSDGRYVIEPEKEEVYWKIWHDGVWESIWADWDVDNDYFRSGSCFVNERSAQRELDLRILIQDIRRYCAENGIEILKFYQYSFEINNQSFGFKHPDYNAKVLFHFKQRIDAANAPFDWRGE